MSAATRDFWTVWFGHARRAGSELCACVAVGIGRSDEIKAVAACARASQLSSNMILSAVRSPLLRGADHPLIRFYATVGGMAQAGDEDPPLWPRQASLCIWWESVLVPGST